MKGYSEEVQESAQHSDVQQISEIAKTPFHEDGCPNFQELISTILKRLEIKFEYNHLLIGSSCLLRFLNDQYSYQRAHGFLRGQHNHRIGSIGEQAFAENGPDFYYQPFTISKRLPFLCCTPDFILKTDPLKLIEIKTSTKIEICKSYFESVPHEFLAQIWLSMEIFGIKECELLIYHYDQQAKRKNRYGYNKFVQLYARIAIKIACESFLERIKPLAIEKYIEFLSAVLEYFSTSISSEEKEWARIKFEHCYLKHQKIKVCMKNVKSLMIDRKGLFLSDACRLKAGLSDDPEQYGTLSRQQFEKQRFADVRQNLKIRKIQQKRPKLNTRTIELNEALLEKILRTDSFMYK
jgi:hypothetical protein